MSKFNIILSDNPWQYKDTAGKRGADKQYATMSKRDLSLLRIGDLAAENCAHVMWVTAPFMPVGISLMKTYGFEYKTVLFTWIKTNRLSGTPFMGMGNYTRTNPEFILLGIRGRMERKSKSVHSVIMSAIRKHSAKPLEARERLVELFGDVPRVELFAREKCDGWTQTGLELDGMDVRDFIEKQSPMKKRSIAALSKIIKRT